jgi:hypothetical protein
MLVEGSHTEPAIYSAWLPFLTGSSRLTRPEDAQAEHGFYLLAGFGYPSLLRRLEDAIADISNFRGFGRLVVALDSEERSVLEVVEEISLLVQELACPVPANVVVAQCCIESWLLGNRKFVKRNPVDALQAFRTEYDVTQQDAELMSNMRPERFNTRAQYHKAYLRAAFRERRLAFSEANPGAALTEEYLEALIDRARLGESPRHLVTFRHMVETVQK